MGGWLGEWRRQTVNTQTNEGTNKQLDASCVTLERLVNLSVPPGG